MSDEQQASTSKARIALFAAVGFGFAVAVCAGVVYCWMTRPKPWNSSAVTASVRDLASYYDSDGSTTELVVNLVLTNRTRSDYRVPSGEKVDVTAQRKDALHLMPGAKLETPLFIPAGRAVDGRILIPIADLWRIGTTRQVPIPLSDVAPLKPEDVAARDRRSVHQVAADSIPSEVTGFTLYDHVNGYVIDVKKAW